HRPFIVTWPLTRVPGRGIAGTIVDEVQLRIVGDPTPGAAAPGLPLVALPSLDARVIADRFPELGRFCGVDQHMVVRPLRMAPPYLPPALKLIAGPSATSPHFAPPA